MQEEEIASKAFFSDKKWRQLLWLSYCIVLAHPMLWNIVVTAANTWQPNLLLIWSSKHCGMQAQDRYSSMHLLFQCNKNVTSCHPEILAESLCLFIQKFLLSQHPTPSSVYNSPAYQSWLFCGNRLHFHTQKHIKYFYWKEIIFAPQSF